MLPVRSARTGTLRKPLQILHAAHFNFIRHLIADHLGWFKETEGTDGGQLKTIEDLMRAKGEKVIRGRLDSGGVVEYAD